MERIKRLLRNRRLLIYAGVAFIILLVIILLAINIKNRSKNDTEEPIEFDYTEKEKYLSDNEKAFISSYLELTDNEQALIANEAVCVYRVLINSNTDLINDKHSGTIKTRLRHSIISNCDYAEELTNEELNALSSGMCEIIYQMILDDVKGHEETKEDTDYLLLTESLKKQIEDLENQKADIKIHIRSELSSDDLLDAFGSMSDEELKDLAKLLGFDDIESLLKAYSNKELSQSDMNKLSGELKKQLEKDIDKKIDDKTKNIKGKDGKDGKDGVNGKNGRDGSDGKDGKSAYELAKQNGYMGSEEQYLKSLVGEDGLTTYIAYADDANGANFSLTPTNTTKYIGSCMSKETSYPTDPKAYTWSEFKDYIITYDPESNTVIVTN